MKKKHYYPKTLIRIVCMIMLLITVSCVSVSVTKDVDSSEDQNKATLRHFIDEVYNKGNIAVFDEVIAENCILHDNEKTVESWETAKRQIRMITSMYRNIQITIEDIIAEGDRVAIRATFQGVFRRNGNSMTSPSITICRFKDDKIIEVWRTFDNVNIFRQLEIAPSSE